MTAAPDLPQNILDRIAALATMAERGTQHEAEVAAEKLATLLAKHGLDTLPQRIEAEEAFGRVDYAYGAATSWRQVLLHAVAKANQCRTVLLGSSRTEARRAAIVGRKHDIEVTQYAYEVLERTIDGIASRTEDSSRSYRNGFRLGCAAGLADALAAGRDSARKQANADTKALIVQDDKALADAVKRAFPHTRRAGALPSYDQRAYGDGHRVGVGLSVPGGLKEGARSAGAARLGAGR